MKFVKSVFQIEFLKKLDQSNVFVSFVNRLFLNDKNILLLIIINALIIFISGFKHTSLIYFILDVLDNVFTLLFIIELIVKIGVLGTSKYFISNWNKLDFTLIIISLPAFFSFVLNIEFIDISYLLVFRVLRVFKSFRLLKFIPGVEHLMNGVKRALRASVFVLVGFTIYIFIIGIFSFHLFRDINPQNFSNPILSLYSVFKIFTVEGWFEIPEQITSEYSPMYSTLIYFYFIFILITGGIFGLSIVNSIFVDAMVSDNNDDLEKKIEQLDKKITELIILNKSNNGISK